MDEEMRAMEREFENDFKFGQYHILRAVCLPLATSYGKDSFFES